MINIVSHWEKEAGDFWWRCLVVACYSEPKDDDEQGCQQRISFYPLFKKNAVEMPSFSDFLTIFPVLTPFLTLFGPYLAKIRPIKNTDQLQMVAAALSPQNAKYSRLW